MCGKNMQKQEEICYVKMFSALGEYQQAYQVRYQLQTQTNGCLMTLQEEAESFYEEQVLLQLSVEQASQMLRFLYENAVTLTLWTDVLDELEVPYRRIEC